MAEGQAPEPVRCAWVGDDPLYRAYHDEEWGVPVRDGRRLFEMLTLEGAQAGLSWLTILRRREGYRRRFEGFDPAAVARWGEAEIQAAVADPGIVRHRGKIESTVSNARAWLALAETTDPVEFLWSFVDGEPIVRRPTSLAEVPAKTPRSEAMSRELRRRGFRFVGPTTCYAFLQAVGMVIDHTTDCFRHPDSAAPSGAPSGADARGGEVTGSERV